jgi:hypothetical protein
MLWVIVGLLILFVLLSIFLKLATAIIYLLLILIAAVVLWRLITGRRIR